MDRELKKKRLKSIKHALKPVYRRLGSENMFLRTPYPNVILVANIQGEISAKSFQEAVKKLSVRHPLLRTRIIVKDRKRAYFTSEGVLDIDVQVLEQSNDNEWKDLIKEELKTPFQVHVGPLIRFILVKYPNYSKVIICAHHAICDGLSLVFSLGDLLMFISQPSIQAESLPIPPRLTEEYIPSSARAGWLTKKMFSFLNKKWEKKNIYFDDSDTSKLHEFYWSKNFISFATLEINKPFSTELFSNCRKERVTVNSAILTALVYAQKKIQGAEQDFFKNIIVAVNLRTRTRKPLDKEFGFYAGAIDLDVEYVDSLDFWDNARRIQAIVNAKNTDERVFASQKLQHLNQPIADAFLFGREGLLEDKMIQKLIKRTGRGKLTAGYTITNLGLLPIPNKYEKIQIESIYAPIVLSQAAEKLIGISTISGNLTITLLHNLKDIDASTMDKIREQVRMVLRKVSTHD